MAYTFDEQIVSDLHKSAYGHRPSTYWWSEWMSASDDRKQDVWDALCAASEQAANDERADNIRAEAAFEKLIAETIALGATDEETAVRWILDGENLSDIDLMYGSDYVAYLFSLPYKGKYDAIIMKVCKQIQADRG